MSGYIPPWKKDHKKGCTGKYRFPTEGDANAMLRRCAHKFDNCWAYSCPHCGGWHVGHIPEEQNG